MKIKKILKNPKQVITSGILLCLLLLSASYAFFSLDSQNLTEEGISFGNGLNISFLLEAKTDLSYSINPLELTEGGKEYAESDPASSIVMLGNNSEYNNVKCFYEIWYIPSEIYNNIASDTTSKEMVIVGTDSSNQNVSFIFDLNGVNSETKMADGIIYVSSKTQDITQNWSFKLRHYNLAVNQNDNQSKTFGGTINFKPLGCKNE